MYPFLTHVNQSCIYVFLALLIFPTTSADKMISGCASRNTSLNRFTAFVMFCIRQLFHCSLPLVVNTKSLTFPLKPVASLNLFSGPSPYPLSLIGVWLKL